MWCRFLKAALRNKYIINTSNVDDEPVRQDWLAKTRKQSQLHIDFDIFISGQK